MKFKHLFFKKNDRSNGPSLEQVWFLCGLGAQPWIKYGSAQTFINGLKLNIFCNRGTMMSLWKSPFGVFVDQEKKCVSFFNFEFELWV